MKPWALCWADQGTRSRRRRITARRCLDWRNAIARLSNLAIVLQMQCRYAEAEQCCREALAAFPGYAAAHCNLLFSLNYRPDLPGEAIFAAYREWDRAAQRGARRRCCEHEKLGARRLRVGYVSPDFRHHSAALFAEPLLAAHDRAGIELFCYADVASPDAVTERFRALADHWRCIAGIGRRGGCRDDPRGPHRRAGRPRRPHRRQPAAGLRAQACAGAGRLPARAWLHARACRRWTPSWPTRLGAAGCGCAVQRTAGAAAADSAGLCAAATTCRRSRPCPHSPTGCVTFGYFGRPDRLNDDVVAAWARILHGVPDSRLVLNSRHSANRHSATLFAERFAAHGIAPRAAGTDRDRATAAHLGGIRP